MKTSCPGPAGSTPAVGRLATSLRPRVRIAPRVGVVLLVASAIGCGLPRKQDVDMAQTVFDLGTALQDVRQNQQDLQDRMDSLTVLVHRQDSTIRSLANLMGAPLPPK